MQKRRDCANSWRSKSARERRNKRGRRRSRRKRGWMLFTAQVDVSDPLLPSPPSRRCFTSRPKPNVWPARKHVKRGEPSWKPRQLRRVSSSKRRILRTRRQKKRSTTMSSWRKRKSCRRARKPSKMSKSTLRAKQCEKWYVIQASLSGLALTQHSPESCLTIWSIGTGVRRVAIVNALSVTPELKTFSKPRSSSSKTKRARIKLWRSFR